MKLFLLLALLPLSSLLAAEAYPVGRRGGLVNNLWTSAGISGGIPSVSTIWTNHTSGVTLAALNNSIATCPSNQVVKLAAGTYNLGGMIDLTKDGVVLRGATNASGIPTAILSNTQVQTVTYYGPESGSGDFPSVTSRAVSSGYTEGSTSITLSTSPNSDFAVGDIFVIDQTDDSSLVYPDSNCGNFTRCGRAYCQALYCTAISGNDITFTPPLLGTYWNASRTVQVYGWSNVYGHSRKRAGIEDFDITEGTADIEFQTLKWMATYECWIKNIRVDLTPFAATALMWSVNSEIRDCIIHDASDNGSGTYGVLAVLATQCRIESNVFTNLSLGITLSSAVGCSISFNVSSGPYPYSSSTWLAEYFFPHGGHSHHTMFEGNWLEGPIYVDSIFGNNDSDLGIVRNRLIGHYTGKTLNTYAIVLEEQKDNTTILGNLLGDNSFHTGYEGSSDLQIFNIDGTASGTIRTNNYNTVSDAVPSGEAIGSATMLDSYVYASKPAWFGTCPWPPFDAAAFGSAAIANIPAGYRLVNGTDPPADSIPVQNRLRTFKGARTRR